MNGSKPISSLQKISDFYANKNSILKKSLTQFVENTKFFPQIGVELEFYLLNQSLQPLENKALIAVYISALEKLFAQDATIYKIEKEQGASQIEIKIAPHSDLLLLAQKIEKIKESAKILAQENNLVACFDSQPFIDDCGSALQFNFSLHDIAGNNLFIKDNFADNNFFIKHKETVSQKNNLLLNTIAGMLDSIEWAMIFYAPQPQDYLRFDLEINRNLHKKGKFTAPVNISFGDDNRTAAVRVLPIKNWQNSHDDFSATKPKEIYYRIEFRVAAANADPYLATSSLLIAILYAINNNMLPQDSQKVFGNAFDEQYSLKKIAANYDEALHGFFRKKNGLF